ncbi:MAG TPA: 16S rRNA (cytidine(1402)-2'-O)-methyltransferase [Propionicimonas sp.]|nr:16S rRNA (cytidine(1402)-2'-O)-methyltransferase [Propionicimonas sp.]HQA77345.1 16S rRNA (cytidine(1402)-2'-O)-methyltransferase [Propionicimonas sp.]HQD97065.1 16S rRNA (cytidine(1402)-2'-O)-methyltransferase [Propionicimonas sp.]
MDDRLAGGVLVLAGTPIGNVSDASAALLEALAGADLIAAEDTRRLRDLVSRLEISTRARVVSYFDGNEASRVDELLAALRDGLRVVVVSDAGMPTVSDPGYRVVAAATAAGLPVRVLPGPSAVLVALALSGLPTDRFCFEGFPPRKGGERRRRLAELATEARTMVFFEAPHRLADFLADARAAFGDDRLAAVSRELTKTYEETRRGSLAELAAWASAGVRGEITVVISGAAAAAVTVADALPLVSERVAGGEPFSAAVAAVAADAGLSRKALYQAALAARKDADG